MKSVLIGAAAIAAAALVTPAVAQDVRSAAPYAYRGDYGGSWNAYAMMPDDARQWTDTHEHRYHGGPKMND
jgi:hypothetical protein